MGMMYADFYRLSTVLQTIGSPEYPREGAGGAKEEGEREGDGEEDVLVGGIGVEALVVEHQERRGDGYPGHQDGRHAHGVERADPPEDAIRVEKKQSEPVGGEHEGDTEDGQEGVEHGVRKQRSLDGCLECFVLQVVEQCPRRFAEEFG